MATCRGVGGGLAGGQYEIFSKPTIREKSQKFSCIRALLRCVGGTPLPFGGGPDTFDHLAGRQSLGLPWAGMACR